MKKFFSLYIVLTMFLSANYCLGSYGPNKENIDPDVQQFAMLRSKLQEAIDDSNGTAIKKIVDEINEIKASEAQWQLWAQKLKVYRFPDQSYKKAVIGEVFFPEKTASHYLVARDVKNQNYATERTKRALYLDLLAHSAESGHSLALAYLHRILQELYEEDENFENESTPLDAWNELIEKELMASVNHKGILAMIQHNDKGFSKAPSLWSPLEPREPTYVQRSSVHDGLQAMEFFERDQEVNSYIAKVREWIATHQGKIDTDAFRSLLQKNS